MQRACMMIRAATYRKRAGDNCGGINRIRALQSLGGWVIIHRTVFKDGTLVRARDQLHARGLQIDIFQS
jgi:hypothetical protein